MGSFRHRKSPSYDRFLGRFSSRPKIGGDDGADGELEEGDFFWTGDDFSHGSDVSSAPVESLSSGRASETRFGVLAALPDEESRNESRSGATGLRRNPSSGWTIPSVPRPKKEEQHLAVRQQSAPVNVPMGVRRVVRRLPVEVELDDDDNEEMLPPHEIVAKRVGKEEPMTTFSVLEGVGRTLKGRDLRRVRNAVWRQTGFLD